MFQQKCTGCGCTEDDCRLCYYRAGKPCSWVYENWCSCCQENGVPSGPIVELFRRRMEEESRGKPGRKRGVVGDDVAKLPPEQRQSLLPSTTEQALMVHEFQQGNYDLIGIAKKLKCSPAYVEKCYYKLFLVPKLLDEAVRLNHHRRRVS